MSFADAARAAAGAATGLLGWRAEDFWAATPEDLRIAVEARMPADVGGLRNMMERDGDG